MVHGLHACKREPEFNLVKTIGTTKVEHNDKDCNNGNPDTTRKVCIPIPGWMDGCSFYSLASEEAGGQVLIS